MLTFKTSHQRSQEKKKKKKKLSAACRSSSRAQHSLHKGEKINKVLYDHQGQENLFASHTRKWPENQSRGELTGPLPFTPPSLALSPLSMIGLSRGVACSQTVPENRAGEAKGSFSGARSLGNCHSIIIRRLHPLPERHQMCLPRE